MPEVPAWQSTRAEPIPGTSAVQAPLPAAAFSPVQLTINERANGASEPGASVVKFAWTLQLDSVPPAKFHFHESSTAVGGAPTPLVAPNVSRSEMTPVKVPFEVASGRGLSTLKPSLKSGPVKGVVT